MFRCLRTFVGLSFKLMSLCLQETAELDMFCLDLDTWTWTQL